MGTEEELFPFFANILKIFFERLFYTQSASRVHLQPQNPLFVNFILHLCLICFLWYMWVGSCVPWTYTWTAFCCNSYLNSDTFFYRDELQQEKQKQKHQQTNASNKITAQVRQPSVHHGVTNQQTKGCKENQFYSLLFVNSPKNITCPLRQVRNRNP